jgi:hypothetical protein
MVSREEQASGSMHRANRSEPRNFERLTVEAARKTSSSPNLGLTMHRTNILMPPKSKGQDRSRAVAIMIHAVWSVSVTTEKGGYCPGGTERPELELELDMTESELMN